MTKRLNILILDDDEARHRTFIAHLKQDHTLTHAWSSQEANSRLGRFSGESTYDVVFLDHDLGEFDEPSLGTGLHVAETMATMPLEHRPSLVVVHSHNPDGAKRMTVVLAAAGVNVVRESFSEKFVKRCARSWSLDALGPGNHVSWKTP